MKAKSRGFAVIAAVLVVAAAAGCGRDSATNPVAGESDPVVFDDDFGDAVDYQAFEGSQYDAVTVDFQEAYDGPASLKVNIPGPGSTNGTYAGGAFTTFNARDLTGYNALSFYAKSSVNSTMDVVGLGNDNTGTSLYDASRTAVPLTTDWARVVIPIPGSSKLTAERGLFYFAEGYENNQGFTVWFDEVEFTSLATITNPRPEMASTSPTTFVGGTTAIEETRVTFDVGREDVTVGHMPAYFDYTSSDELVAVVANGVIQGVGGGTATVTAKLDTVDVTGEVTVTVLGAPTGPAAAPTVPDEDVISLFSDVYTDVAVDTWHANWEWSTGEVTDFAIQGDNVKVYTDLNFAGIEFVSGTIDVSEMTHFHMDVWAPEGTEFLVKLVDFGEDGAWGGAPDSFAELTFDVDTTPAFVAGAWCALEIPMADFENAPGDALVSNEHLAQLVISSSDVSTVIVDNVYFHK